MSQIKTKLPLLAGACALVLTVSQAALANGAAGGSIGTRSISMAARTQVLRPVSEPSMATVSRTPGMGFRAPVTGTRIPVFAGRSPTLGTRNPAVSGRTPTTGTKITLDPPVQQ